MALSDKLNILFPKVVDESSIDVTPAAVSTLPEENVFNDRRDKFMRVTGTSAVIKFDALALGPATGIAFSHNLDDGSTVRVRLFSAIEQGGTTEVDSATLTLDIDNSLDDYLTQIFYYPFDEVDFLSVQIDISAPTNTQIDIGRIMIGEVFEPSWNYEWGRDWQWIDEGDAITASVCYRAFKFDLSNLNDTENNTYKIQKIKAAKQGDVLVCLQPSATGFELLKSTAICKRVNDISAPRTRYNNNQQIDTYQEVY